MRGLASLGLALFLLATPAAACPNDATVVRVVDGDTFDASISLGFGLTLARRVRLLGYNAPESTGPEKTWGALATQALRAALPVGARLFLEARKVDAFGRVLADVVLPGAPAETLTDRLVREGWGVRWDGAGKRPTPWFYGVPYPIRPGAP